MSQEIKHEQKEQKEHNNFQKLIETLNGPMNLQKLAAILSAVGILYFFLGVSQYEKAGKFLSGAETAFEKIRMKFFSRAPIYSFTPTAFWTNYGMFEYVELCADDSVSFDPSLTPIATDAAEKVGQVLRKVQPAVFDAQGNPTIVKDQMTSEELEELQRSLQPLIDYADELPEVVK